MKKRIFGRKLSRSRPSREALFAGLTRAMIVSGKIVTTKAKAKAVQRDIEKVVTLAKKGTIQTRRKAHSMLDNANDATDKLFSLIAESFKDRSSGFTRIINLVPRKGDNAQMVRMEWTETIIEASKKTEVKEKKGEKKTKAEKVKKAKKTTKTVSSAKVSKKK